MSRMVKRIVTNAIVVHCSASLPKADWGASEIRRIHVAENGWDDIGYHFVITRDGVVEYGRHKDYRGAHAPKVNANSISICLVGGAEYDCQGKLVSDYNFTPVQITELSALVKELQLEYPAARRVLGHNDVGGSKDCPTFNVPHWWDTGIIEHVVGRDW